jgi:3D (Asp-Asp-Asp) domain-containing protein
MCERQEDAQVIQDPKPRMTSLWKWRPVMTGLALAVSLGFARSIDAPSRWGTLKDFRASVPVRPTPLASVSVTGRGIQSLSPELMREPVPISRGEARDEVTPHPASSPAPLRPPGPFLRGLYTGAAKILAQSHGKSRIVWMEVTAYCPCTKCCGPGAAGITASGKPVSYNDGAFAAADADEFSFGAKLRVPGYHDGKVIEVIDRGSAIKHAKVDVFFPTHEQAEAWGRQWVPVIVEN